MSCIETLDGVLAGGLEAGRWCWFHDLNNQSLTNRFDRHAKDRLESFDPVRMPLRINCRNTPGHPGMDTGHARRRPGRTRSRSRSRRPPADRRHSARSRRTGCPRARRAGGCGGPRTRLSDDPFAARLWRVFRRPDASGRRAPGPAPGRVFHAGGPWRQGRIRKDRGVQRSRERGDRRRGPSRPGWSGPEIGRPLRGHEPGALRTVADPPGVVLSPRSDLHGFLATTAPATGSPAGLKIPCRSAGYRSGVRAGPS